MENGESNNKPVSVRYMVNNVDESIAFYANMLGFRVEMYSAEEIAILARENLRFLLSKPSGRGGGGQGMPDGTIQTPGGWNRFEIEVNDLEEEVGRLKDAGYSFRNEIVKGVGGKQILLNDLSGNIIELFEYYE